MGRARSAVVHFWRKAYEDNLTGLASMVAYNLLLSIFPLALVALWIAGRVLRSNELQNSVLARPPAAVSQRRREHAEHRDPSAAGDIDDRRHPRDRRRDLVRVLVLGRARHRVLPHLPPRLPHVGAPEAVRARDVRRRAAVHHRQRVGAGGCRACLPAARATCRSGSPTCAAWSTASRSSAGIVVAVHRRCAPPTHWSRAGGCRGAASGRAPLGATLAIGVARLRVPALPAQRLDAARRHDVRVRADRARVVLRARDHRALGSGGRTSCASSTVARLARSVGDRDGGADEALWIRDRGRRSVVLGPGRAR